MANENIRRAIIEAAYALTRGEVHHVTLAEVVAAWTGEDHESEDGGADAVTARRGLRDFLGEAFKVVLEPKNTALVRIERLT